MPLDAFGRNIHYLRVSLTDRCNLRCVYCLPANIAFRPAAALMRDDELRQVVRLFAELGFDKFRLTGGEPTARAHLVELVRDLARIPGVRSLSMTTNGTRLKQLAQPLAEAGLQRVNISLDALEPEAFRRLARRAKVGEVWEGILAAEAAGLTPIKLNAVIVRGYNDETVLALAALTREHAWQVRFIELMPFGEAAALSAAHLVPTREIRQRIETILGELRPLDNPPADAARLYRFPNAPGAIGFISAVSHPFCPACARARLTADGKLRLCLLREDETDLLTPLRAGAAPAELKMLIRQALRRKPWSHRLAQAAPVPERMMSEIGG